jgi:hypothetical protein
MSYVPKKHYYTRNNQYTVGMGPTLPLPFFLKEIGGRTLVIILNINKRFYIYTEK